MHIIMQFKPSLLWCGQCENTDRIGLFYLAYTFLLLPKTNKKMEIEVYPAISGILPLSALKTVTFMEVVTKTLSVTISLDGQDILSGTYYRDENHSVTLYDIDRLLLDNNVRGSRMYALVVKAGNQTFSASVFYCRCLIEGHVDSFLKKCFLNSSASKKTVYPGNTEFLSFYNPDNDEFFVELKYFNGSVFTAWDEISPVDGFRTLNLNPEIWERADARLIGFDVHCGGRHRSYVVDYNEPEADPAVVYNNCFGMRETFYFRGIKETVPSVIRSTAVIGGDVEIYDVEKTITHKVNTGFLRQADLEAALDMAESDDIHLLLENGASGAKIVFTDSDLKYQNALNSIRDLTFTYRLARRTELARSAPKKVRIFDNSFDETYE